MGITEATVSWFTNGDLDATAIEVGIAVDGEIAVVEPVAAAGATVSGLTQQTDYELRMVVRADVDAEWQWTANGPTHDITTEAANPVLFIHGFTGSASTWSDTLPLFESANYDSSQLFTITYNSTTQSNVATAGVVNATLDDIMATTGAEQVDIVAHSMGALNTRWCIKFVDGCGEKVEHWVSIGGASQGTSTASLCTWIYVTCREMVSTSDFLATLNAAPMVTEGTDWYSVWSPEDTVISPATNSIVDGATNIEVTGSHSGMLGDPEVIVIVTDILTGAYTG
ncbi:MAG: lipase [Acidimicrobiia bacterium]|nr:lipase [Acidimicrobiia bacterium]